MNVYFWTGGKCNMSTIESRVNQHDIEKLCNQILKYNYIDPADFDRFNVKRGLRNSD